MKETEVYGYHKSFSSFLITGGKHLFHTATLTKLDKVSQEPHTGYMNGNTATNVVLSFKLAHILQVVTLHMCILR